MSTPQLTHAGTQDATADVDNIQSVQQASAAILLALRAAGHNVPAPVFFSALAELLHFAVASEGETGTVWFSVPLRLRDAPSFRAWVARSMSGHGEPGEMIKRPSGYITRWASDRNDPYTPVFDDTSSEDAGSAERKSSARDWSQQPTAYRPSSAKGHGVSFSADETSPTPMYAALRPRANTVASPGQSGHGQPLATFAAAERAKSVPQPTAHPPPLCQAPAQAQTQARAPSPTTPPTLADLVAGSITNTPGRARPGQRRTMVLADPNAEVMRLLENRLQNRLALCEGDRSPTAAYAALQRAMGY